MTKFVRFKQVKQVNPGQLSVLDSLNAWAGDEDEEEVKTKRTKERKSLYKAIGADGEAPPEWKVQMCAFIESMSDTDSKYFNMFMGIIIVLNSIVIGLETDLGRGKFHILEHLFLFIFLSEMILRLCDKKLEYFKTTWNLFDIALILTGALDLWVLPVVASAGLGIHWLTSLRLLRMIRILRLLRILRVFRLFRLFTELHLIMQAFAKAFQVILIVSLLTFILNYACAILLTQMVGHNAADWKEDSDKISQWFGTIPSSMRTLFFVMTLTDWESVPMTISKHLPTFPVMIMFIGYVMIASYTTVSLVTAIIGESLVAAAVDFKDRRVMAIEDDRARLHDEFTEYVNEMLQDDITDDMADAVKLKKAFQGDKDMHAKFLAIQVVMNDQVMSDIIDDMCKGSQKVNVVMFVDRLCSLVGSGKNGSVMEVKHIALTTNREIAKCQSSIERVETKMESITSKIDALMKK